ncbi:hypothetical protein BV898_00494 [Hypsibius exemplaris]|uniref:Uncharacterized protein n=1 Tax=Hypsibius exemplaris TaxID=2072580 RepID=A0A1W0XDK3_HYPEX|nr:hypothetical protein BV898_00494 [Hypsibius exemplaris]
MAAIDPTPATVLSVQQENCRPWLGMWVSAGKKENWPAVMEALGLPEMYSEKNTFVLKLWCDGEDFHYDAGILEAKFKHSVTFKLGTPTELNHGNKIVITYTEEDGKLIADGVIAAKNLILHNVFAAQGDVLIKTYRVGNVVAKSWYRRLSSTADSNILSFL